jgi:hypothetical protein
MSKQLTVAQAFTLLRLVDAEIARLYFKRKSIKDESHQNRIDENINDLREILATVTPIIEQHHREILEQLA